MLEYWIYLCVLPAVFGFFLDLILGDPQRITHPVVRIGRLISALEKRLRRLETARKDWTDQEISSRPSACRSGENVKKGRQRSTFFLGCVEAVLVVTLSTACSVLIVWLFSRVHIFCAAAFSTLLCWQMYAAKSLKKESMKVYDALKRGSCEDARYAVSMIVGRDTSVLDEKGIIRAAVETVAENTSDGVIAPMFYMALGGPAGAYLYKSVNTMDSMIGYRNETYEYFGKCAARMDDVLNFIPARISGLLIVAATAVLNVKAVFLRIFCREKGGAETGDFEAEAADAFLFDPSGALRIFFRDRGNHASPNSAQTESACAGALGIRLGGPAVYFGRKHDKPYIGDGKRAPEYEDIRRANRLMYGASGIGIFLVFAAAFFVVFVKI